MTLVLFVAATLLLRTLRTPHRVRVLTLAYAVCMAILVALWRWAPDDLGFLPALLLTEPRWLDFAATLFFFSAAFFGGVLQLYNLADRGFSLRILIDAMESPATGDVDRLMANYSRGQGISWMYRKRMEGLLAGGLIERSNASIVLTAKGARAAALFSALRDFLRVEGTGECGRLR
jgi:hypothetical protein